MARRNSSFQQLFLETLGGVGDTAMKAGGMLADDRRANAADTRANAANTREAEEHQARLPGVKAEAGAKSLDYDKALREDSVRKSIEGGIDAFKADPLYADAKLASMTLGRTVTPEELRTQRGRKDKVEGLEVEEKEFGLGEKKNKAGRDAETHKSDLETAGAQRRLLGANAEKATREANAPPKPEKMPIDVESEVRALSGKTAGKKAIANQLENDLKQMRKAMGQDETGKPIPGAVPDEDLAYSYAQNMLKTMNSKEGADAVGVDEAKRAAGLLEYNVADVKAGLGFKPGKFHGRDIPGFLKQVESNITGIRGAVNANRGEVDSLMGRTPEAPAAPAGGLDANDPKVKAALAAGYTEDEIRSYLGKGK